MRGPNTALVWELARTTAWKFVTAAFIGMFFFTRRAFVGEPAFRSPRAGEALHQTLDLSAGFAIGMAIMAVWWIAATLGNLQGGLGYPLRHWFVRPLTTTRIVVVPMTFLALCGAVLYVSFMCWRATLIGFDPSLPSFTVLVFLLSYVAIMLSWAIVPRFIFVFWIIVLGAAFALVWLLRSGVWLPEAGWSQSFSLSLLGAAELILIGLGAIALTVLGTHRQRHGGPADRLRKRSPAPIRGKHKSRGFADVKATRLSPVRAEFWRSLRTQAMPSSRNATMFATIGVLNVLFTGNEGNAAAFLPIMLIGLLLAAGFTGLGLGTKPGARPLSSFEATCPVTTAQLASWRLLAAGLGFVPSALMLSALYLGVGSLLSEPIGDYAASLPGMVFSDPTALVYRAIFVLFQMATTIAFFAAISAFFALQGLATFVVGIGLFFFLIFMMGTGNDNPSPANAEIVLTVTGTVIVALGVISARHIHRYRLLGPRPVLIGLAIWLVYWLVWFVPVDADSFYREDLPTALVNMWLFAASFGPFVAVALAITALHLVRHR